MNVPEMHRRSLDEFDRRVQAVQSDQWDGPTPCTEWDVHALVNHLVNESRWTRPMLEGKTIEEVGDRFDGDLLGDDPQTAWKEAYEEAVAAVQEDGAMERTVHLSYGDTPAADYVIELATDHLIHAWDLARAVGADEKLDPELVDLVYERAKPQEDKLKGYGIFGDKVEPPPGADTQTRLLAVFGRRA